MFLNVVFRVTTVTAGFETDLRALLILVLLIITGVSYKKVSKKNISPIILILISAVMGIILY